MEITLRRASIAVAAACFAGILAGVALRNLAAADGWYYVLVLGICGLAVLRAAAPEFGFAPPRRLIPSPKRQHASQGAASQKPGARPEAIGPTTGDLHLVPLWLDYKRTGSHRAREQLVVAYSPLVKYVASRMSAGLPSSVVESDLFSYGLIGLVNAIERFDLDRGIRFETHALTRIKGAIIDELRMLDWAPRPVRARARQIELAHSKLESVLRRIPTDEEMAAELNVSIDQFRRSLVEISNSTLVALDDLWAIYDSSGDEVSLLETLQELEARDPARMSPGELSDRLAAAIAALPDREKLVLALYYYETFSMREIGELLGLGTEHVAELHSRAMLRLGKDLRNCVLADAYEVSRDHSPEATQRRPWLAATGSI